MHRLLGIILLLLVPFGAASAQSPALSPIVDITLNADATATVNIVAVDEGGGQITLSSALPSFGTLNSPTIGLGVVMTTLTLAPSDIHTGTYTAAVVATAGGVSETEIFQITVNPAGSPRAPIVSSPALREVTAGETLSFTVNVSDPDAGGIESLEASMLPSGAVFAPNASSTAATFTWTPAAEDAGAYDVLFLATALNGLSGGAVTHLRVMGPPVLALDPIDDVTVEGGSSLSVSVHASGVPGATIILTASLPSFATLNPPGMGMGAVSTTITVSPPTGSAGTYHASVTAISNGDFVTEPFDIIVTGTGGPENHPPFVSAPDLATVAIGSSLSFDVTATDPDGDPVDLFGSALPPGSSFLDHGDNTGTFTWSPVAGQQGTHFASFSGLDNRGGSGSASTQIVVTGEVEQNEAPNLSAPATQEVDEGVTLSFLVTAFDPDGDPVALTADGVPSGATFVDQGDDTALFTWTPDFSQSGVYGVAFTGTDGQGGSGTASTSITVLDADVAIECSITGDLSICAGGAAELCGPENAETYSWSGPEGFTAETPCISVGAAGLYELTVVDAEARRSSCSATVTVSTCDGHNCPRGPGFWKQQCAQRGNGSTKFDRAQMDEITACVDAASEFFDWESDFDGFCATVDPQRPMNLRKQAARMYAVLLANVCTGQLGLVANNGDRIALDPNTAIECQGIEGAETIAELMAAADSKLAELAGMDLNWHVRSAYERLKGCMEAINDGIGIGPTCQEDEEDELAAAACLVGRFKPWKEKTCFRIKPLHDSFDPRDVVLSSVMLQFRGASIAPLADRVQLDIVCSCDDRDDDDCEDGHGKNGDDEDRDDDRDDDGDHDDRCGVSCDDRGECHGDKTGDRDRDDDDDDDRDHAECDTVGIRACFSTSALLELFAGAELPCDLLEAEMQLTLTNGATIVARFDGNGRGHDDEDDDDDDEDRDAGGDSNDAQSPQSTSLLAKVNPNPFNPRTELSFATSREGLVRVTIYDVQGRLVRTLLDEHRPAGEQRLVWDGSSTNDHMVRSGVYFMRIQAPDGEATQKLTVLK